MVAAEPALQDLAAQPASVSTSIRLSEVAQANLRLEASAYDLEVRAAVDALRASGYALLPMYGKDGLCKKAHNAFRFRRIYVSPDRGTPFFSSSDIIDLRPTPDRFLSNLLTRRLDDLIVREWDILISCSGTVGNVALASAALAGAAVSQHVIRVQADDPKTAGFIVAFLRSPYGRVQLTRASYGSVVRHIEPDHLTRVVLPAVPEAQVNAIGTRMIQGSVLRDKANELLGFSEELLLRQLALPPLDDRVRSTTTTVRCRSLDGRLDASFHDPTVKELGARLRQSGHTLDSLGSAEVSREIRPITKFRKRVYVRSGGIPFYTSKQIFQFDPVDIKRLAKGAHTKDLPEIALEPNMILVTRSGTIGRCQIVPTT